MVARVVNEGEDWVRLEVLSSDGTEFTLAADGDEQAIIRFEDCALFRPGGIGVSVDELRWDLCTQAPLPASDFVGRGFNVDCGNARIAEHVARLNDGWALDETRLTSTGGTQRNLYAGSFGEFRGMFSTQLQDTAELDNEDTGAPQVPVVTVPQWMDQLVTRGFGAEGASHVRRYLADPDTKNFYRLGPIIRSRLMPYIQAAAQRQNKKRTEGD
jgi:hypothetical protein